MPNVDRAIVALRDISCQLMTEEARLASAMRRLYLIGGSFNAVVSATQTELRTLAAQVTEEGGSTEGWIG